MRGEIDERLLEEPIKCENALKKTVRLIFIFHFLFKIITLIPLIFARFLFFVPLIFAHFIFAHPSKNELSRTL